MTGFSATDEVSLNGSPTVSPTTVASCSGVPFSFSSTSTTFFALSHAPPALAMNIAWYKPNIAIEIRKLTKNETASGVLPGAEKNANASANENIAVKMLNIPFFAYFVQIFTTSFEVSVDAILLAFSSSLIFFLLYSTARYEPVVTACID